MRRRQAHRHDTSTHLRRPRHVMRSRCHTGHGVVVILIAQPRRFHSHASKHAVHGPDAPQQVTYIRIYLITITTSPPASTPSSGSIANNEGSGQTLMDAPSLPKSTPFVATLKRNEVAVVRGDSHSSRSLSSTELMFETTSEKPQVNVGRSTKCLSNHRQQNAAARRGRPRSHLGDGRCCFVAEGYLRW